MNIPISATHRQRIEEIRRDLHIIRCRESEFLKIQLLFFEVLDISKVYGHDVKENSLLAALKNVQCDEYQKTQIITSKANQRESSIRKFVISLRKVLSATHQSYNW